MILAGDVGGTTTRLGCFPVEDEACVPVAQCNVPTRNYPALEAILEEFLSGRAVQLRGVCLGVAAPVVEGRTQPVNLPWVVETQALQRLLGLEAVWLINDMEATAYGTQVLSEGASAVLQSGQPAPRGNLVVIAPGTSLGEATLIWDAQGYRAIASEGGHADYAPRSATELALYASLAKTVGHVSYARVLSGPGLHTIYQFLKAEGVGEEPPWLADQLLNRDPSECISAAALEGRSRLCAQAVDLFVSILGAEAGNLALRSMARGGVYVGGGIAPRILEKLRDGTFLKAFVDKGRLKPLLSTIPVRVILEEQAALYGAASHGRSLVAAHGK